MKKVLTAGLEVPGMFSIYINFKRLMKLMSRSYNTEGLCNTAAKVWSSLDK